MFVVAVFFLFVFFFFFLFFFFCCRCSTRPLILSLFVNVFFPAVLLSTQWVVSCTRITCIQPLFFVAAVACFFVFVVVVIVVVVW